MEPINSGKRFTSVSSFKTVIITNCKHAELLLILLCHLHFELGKGPIFQS